MTKTARTGRLASAEDFGQLIRRRRRALGMTQLDLALTINAGERFIVELERGKPSCQLGKALKTAAAVGVRLGDLADVEASDIDKEDGYGSLFDPS
ncbi:helix-turn-helix domain-containing protein [Rhodovibrio salinarum]|uniref:Transcriptional regulator n=1 Tax=Rhodovibrio salinarum TaxID=1087 RepID=A0A934UYX2_9PROT|nr:helix-turn-helix domain-containing protein [Rhodovibrio salinarum]MBK1696223.1 transcriptional regulator [Rhodovibrio salinarum]